MSVCVCVYVCVALVIQHAMRMCHIVICGLPGTTLLFHIISSGTIFEIRKVIEHKIYVLIFFTIFD
jgi:hypothetical protein